MSGHARHRPWNVGTIEDDDERGGEEDGGVGSGEVGNREKGMPVAENAT